MSATLGLARDLAATQLALRDAVAAQLRELAEARERGRAVDVERLREAHVRLTASLAEIRDRERRNTRDMLAAAGITVGQIEQMSPLLEERRDAHRADMVVELDTIVTEVRCLDWERELAPHNERARATGREHVRSVEARFYADPDLGRSRVDAGVRDLRGLAFRATFRLLGAAASTL